MARPITEKVFFTVNVRSYDRGDHWVTKAVESGIFTYGATREEAEARSGEANEILIRRMKAEGLRALARFMKERGIKYRVGGTRPRNTGKPTITWGPASLGELARAA